MITGTLIPQPLEYCPQEVTEPLLNIIEESLSLMRMAGNAGDADYCAAEANHIHNLPSLLRHYNRAKLERYLHWAQTEYAVSFQQRFHRPPSMFIPSWQMLDNFLTANHNQ